MPIMLMIVVVVVVVAPIAAAAAAAAAAAVVVMVAPPPSARSFQRWVIIGPQVLLASRVHRVFNGGCRHGKRARAGRRSGFTVRSGTGRTSSRPVIREKRSATIDRAVIGHGGGFVHRRADGSRVASRAHLLASCDIFDDPVGRSGPISLTRRRSGRPG